MGGYSDTYSDLYDPAFPASPLDLRTELTLGGAWTDISTGVYYRGGVAIARGHPDESSAANPASSAMTLDNRGGVFSPRNPLGPYYGLIGRNTPLRQSVPAGSVCLRLEDGTSGYASCRDRAALDITGDIDVRLDMQLSGYGQMTLATKWLTLADRSWALRLNPDGTLAWEYLNGAGAGRLAVGDTPIPLGRVAVRVTWKADNGAGGHTTTFYTAPAMAGPWTQLGSSLSSAGVFTLAVTAAPLVVGFSPGYITNTGNTNHTGPTGKLYAFELLSGIGGTPVASPDFTAQSPGAVSFTDAQANLWSLAGGAEISDRRYRFHGEVPAWPPRWDETGRDVTTPIQAAGLLRRLTQSGSGGSTPINSALYRAYVRLAGPTAPIAYWPCEDGATSTQLASALGGTAMMVRGAPQLASDSSFLCSAALPVVGGSTWVGVVPAVPTSANTLRFLLKVPSSSPPTDGAVLARLYTYGTVNRADLIYRTGGGLQLKGVDQAGTLIFDTGAVAFGILDRQPRVSVELQEVGGVVQYSMVAVYPGVPGAVNSTGTVAGTIGGAYQVWIAPDGDVAQAVIGHVTVQAAWDTLFNIASALDAWQGEGAAARFARLCTEEGLGSRVYGHPADSTPMGPQGIAKLTELLQQCEDADGGLQFEPRQTLGLGYRTRASMLNQAPALALDYSLAQLSPPLEPTDDDQYVTNDVTATRTGGGSSARQIDSSGPMSVQPPPAGIGRYDSAVSANLASDTQLDDDAGWAVHLGTVDELRYPALSVQLARGELAALSGQAQDVEIGDRVTVVNTPSWLPPDGISQIVRGMSEAPYGFTFGITWVCVPESPYRVGVYDDPVLGRYDTDGSTLQAGISAAAVTMLVTTSNPGSPLWTTIGGDFPFDIEVGGERMTVTNVTGANSPQAFTVTRSVNGVVKPQKPGTDVRLFQPAVYSM